MARIRTIKPEFWTDERLTECSLSARLLFIGMLNFADDNGNLQRSAKRIKMQVFPADSIDCEPLIIELITHGLLTEYSVSEDKYLNIKNFKKHQIINRPSKSVIPQPPFSEGSLSTHGVLTDGKEGNRKGKEEEKKEEKELSDDNSKKPVNHKILKPDEVSEQVWLDFLQLRKEKRAALTATALEGIRREAVKAGLSLNDALATSCRRGWQGFEAAWLREEKQKTTAHFTPRRGEPLKQNVVTL